MSYIRKEFLVSSEQLAASLGDPDLVVLDCTSTVVPSASAAGGFAVASGRQAFIEGHIPGAQFVDIEHNLSIHVPGLLFTLPTAEAFGDAMRRFGIGAKSRVILYSTGQPGWAARVWLMLHAFSFDNAAVLDGGWRGWQEANLPVEQGDASPRPLATSPFDWQLREGIFVSAADVEARGNAALVNALGPDAFRGDAAIVYGRPGHIPGSLNIPTFSLVDHETGKYHDQATLDRIFEQAGITSDAPIIAYCGAGVAASNVAFARILTGKAAPTAVYDGSMLDWASDPARPLVTN